MTKVYVPAGVVGEAVIVSVELPEGMKEVGLKFALAPDGRPDKTDRLTGTLKPLRLPRDTV